VPGVAFAIELPTGLVREAKDAYVNWTWPDGTFNAPSITVMAIELPPADLAAAVTSAKRTSDPELVVATQREVDGGFLVSVPHPRRPLPVDQAPPHRRRQGPRVLGRPPHQRQAGPDPPRAPRPPPWPRRSAPR
jgi:hypothetical protein